MKKHEHKIQTVSPGSLAEELELEPGDLLLEINGHCLEDIFDYQFYMEDSYVELLIRKADGEEWLLEVEKDEDEDLGVTFESGLMDEYRTCKNHCMFCFIDQMPPGMRETLYLKDDDSRLSFLQGNYITLTNMSEQDIERIISYHLSPINISIHTLDPDLRCKMLHNRFAGSALEKLERLYEAGVRMNGQIVLCRGINDREKLEETLEKLEHYLPHMESVSVVPVGLSKFRDGLYPLEPLTRDDMLDTIERIERWQKHYMEHYGTHYVHASDEFYLMCGLPLPEEARYDGYLQLENGVGMFRLLHQEVQEALAAFSEEEIKGKAPEHISIATGKLAAPFIRTLADLVSEKLSYLTVSVYAIENRFFGELITVSGLITGQDLTAQMKEHEIGSRLLIPENMLRSGEDVFLDDMTVSQAESTLQTKIDIVKSSGQDFVLALQGKKCAGSESVFRPYEIKEN